jgi:hypothetical protein
MVKSIEQQIIFLNRDLLPLYGIESTKDSSTVINTELLNLQGGFLDELNKLLPLVTLLYPIKKFNLHKINHMIQTIRQAFSLLVHCLEISQIPHTIWTKKHCRKNVRFLRLNSENCTHRPIHIIHSIRTPAKMTQSQTSCQQLYNMVKNVTLDDDDKNNCAQEFIGNPQVTLFTRVVRRPTHYRKFPMELRKISNGFTIDHKEYNEINAITNLIIVFTTDNYQTFDEAMSFVTHVTVTIGNTSLFDVDGAGLLTILKLYPELYAKSLGLYKHGKIIIPLQYFLMQDVPLVLCRFDENFSVTFVSKYNADCFCNGYKLTDTEYNRFKENDSETYIWQYLLTEKTQCDSIILDSPICISELIVKPIDQTEYTIRLNDIPLLSTRHPLMEYDTSLIKEENTYYYLSQICTHTRVEDPFGGFIIGQESTKLVISPKCPQMRLIIRFRSHLRDFGTKVSLSHLTHALKPNYDHFYPLTKIREGHYVEGYWYAGTDAEVSLVVDGQKLTCDMREYQLPFPKQTETAVNEKFLQKLLEVQTAPSCKKEDYFGFSGCRLCHKANGGTEYSVTNNGQTFTFPSGLIHYYEEHNVQPSKEFYDFIMALP